jgi:hypothetical protein
MNCEFPSTKKGSPCLRCGFRLPMTFPDHPTRECRGASGLGDRVTNAVKFVAALLRLEEILAETPDCGCNKRRETLNRWDRKVRSIINRVIRNVVDRTFRRHRPR